MKKKSPNKTYKNVRTKLKTIKKKLNQTADRTLYKNLISEEYPTYSQKHSRLIYQIVDKVMQLQSYMNFMS